MWCRVGVAVVLARLGTLACGGPSFVGPTSGSGLEEVDRFARSFIAKWDVKAAAQFAVVPRRSFGDGDGVRVRGRRGSTGPVTSTCALHESRSAAETERSVPT